MPWRHRLELFEDTLLIIFENQSIYRQGFCIYLDLKQVIHVIIQSKHFCVVSKNLKIKIYKTIILPVVLYGCEKWSLTLREESRLRVFENRVLRWIFWPNRDKNGELRKLHNEELHSLYRSPNIVKVIKSIRLRCAGHVVRMEEGWSPCECGIESPGL